MIHSRDVSRCERGPAWTDERAMLEARIRAPSLEQRHVLRARTMLLAAESPARRAIAGKLDIMPRTASLWRIRFAEAGLDGLADKPRPGGRASAAKYDASTKWRILALLDRRSPVGHGRWTGKLLAAALGDVSDQYDAAAFALKSALGKQAV